MAWPEALSQMPLKLQPNSAIQIYYYYYSFGGDDDDDERIYFNVA